MKRTVYKVGVGDDPREAPARIYRVIAANAKRATDIARAHSAFASAWPLGKERHDVVSEEGILAIGDAD